MPITTDTDAMRQTLNRISEDVLASMNDNGTCTVNVADLTTLLAAYKIERNKNRRLTKVLSSTNEA